MGVRSAAFYVCLLAQATPNASWANEEVEICAEYSSTGNSYHVSATLMTGSELNSATHRMDYESLGRYVVIFWAQNEASVIEMDSPFIGLSSYGSTGRDQQGRSWEISAYSSLRCGR
jgi:hypothetical protein